MRNSLSPSTNCTSFHKEYDAAYAKSVLAASLTPDCATVWHAAPRLQRLPTALERRVHNSANQPLVAPSQQLRHDDQVAVIGVEARQRIHFQKVGNAAADTKVDARYVPAAQLV